MQGFGKFLMACGVMLGVYAYLIDPIVTRSIVESFADDYGPRVADLALLNQKTNLMIAGAALFLGGCRFAASPEQEQRPPQ